MKILCQIRSGASLWIRTGWKNAFEALGHQFYFWNPDQINPFDVFSQLQPDIFLGETWTLSRSLFKCLVRNPQVRVGMVGSNWGDLDEQVRKTHPEVLHANQNEISNIKELYKQTGKPEFVTGHYLPKWIDKTHNLWATVGPKPVSMLSAADVFMYCGGEEKEHLRSDISLISGNWAYKNRTLGKWFNPLCHPVGRYNIKVWGHGHAIPQALGAIDEDEAKHVFKSAKILVNIHEEHSQVYHFDVVERPYKVMGAGGGVLISDYVESMQDMFEVGEKIFQTECILAKTPDDFREKIDFILAHEGERKEISKAAQNRIFNSHTYLHRAVDFFRYFNLEYEAEKAQQMIPQILEKFR